MNKTVDIYLPLDSREKPNRAVWPLVSRQVEDLKKVIKKCGWNPHVLNPDKPVSSVSEGMQVIGKCRGERFINFFGGWAYPDFSVSPMWQLSPDLPKLMLGSAVPDYPGAVGLLAAAAGTEHVGISTSRVFAADFSDHESYIDPIKTFLETGRYQPQSKTPITIDPTPADREKALQAAGRLQGSLYGSIGPRSMEMWNKISEADFLKYFGCARLGFDGLRLLKMAESVPDQRAEDALNFLVEKGMDIRIGPNPEKHLTRDMVIFQMKVYFALLELKDQFGLDFLGVQDQLDWILYYPATDLALGLLNNRLRPETNNQTVVTATEADDGAAVTMQLLKLLNGGEPVGFNDLRYWDPQSNLYWFVNSGALAPYFAEGSHDSLKGSWSERQTYMYFKQGGGTSTLVARVSGIVTWARFSFRSHQLYLCAGRGLTDVPTEEQWRERSKNCSSDWPHWYLRLCGRIEEKINSNHPITALGDHLGALKAFAEEIGIPFECCDTIHPNELS
jgi:L-fucose isomerase-like protein